MADFRKEKNWSQTDLATSSGISHEMIGKYERGDAAPSIEPAKKIADAFGVPPTIFPIKCNIAEYLVVIKSKP